MGVARSIIRHLLLDHGWNGKKTRSRARANPCYWLRIAGIRNDRSMDCQVELLTK